MSFNEYLCRHSGLWQANMKKKIVVYQWLLIKTLIYCVKFFYHSSLCKKNLPCRSVFKLNLSSVILIELRLIIIKLKKAAIPQKNNCSQKINLLTWIRLKLKFSKPFYHTPIFNINNHHVQSWFQIINFQTLLKMSAKWKHNFLRYPVHKLAN